jgi:hypothetical protein
MFITCIFKQWGNFSIFSQILQIKKLGGSPLSGLYLVTAAGVSLCCFI